jgi:hypothetical protein
MRIGILNGQYRAMADDATLIAYLRNNAEAIADLIDAAYALRNESMPVSKRSHVVRTALFTDLRDALAKLSEDA